MRHRKLDQGNPNPGNLGADFGIFGLRFWRDVQGLDSRNQSRQALLEALNETRNAIAHRDFAKLPERERLPLHRVKAWRAACNQLTTAFDEAMRRHLQSITGVPLW